MRRAAGALSNGMVRPAYLRLALNERTPTTGAILMPKPSDLATTYGMDIGKNGFHLIVLDRQGAIQRPRLSRTTVFKFFAAARPALVGMEACPGSQWLARELIELSHGARIMPARFVKPFVKSNKERHARCGSDR
jgi:hypothetical protein